jgi:hypothetical protein
MTRLRNWSMSVPREDRRASPGRLDLILGVADAAQVAGQRGPFGRGVPGGTARRSRQPGPGQGITAGYLPAVTIG